MPTLTRVYVKTSLVYLAAALFTALLLAGQPVVKLAPWLYALSPVSFHLFLLGWVAQLIFGIVFWMFPKYSKERPRGNETLAWAVYGMLNAGLLLRLAAEPWQTVTGAGGPAGWALALSALLQWLAGLGFVINTWPRVKER